MEGKNMRFKSIVFLLAAGMALSLIGCEKEPDNRTEGAKEVRFTATDPNPETKTVYTGEGTGDPGNLSWERIDWVQGDPLLIWSDYAYAKNQSSTDVHSAHYLVGSPTRKDESEPYPNQSWSIINDYVDLGLLFDDSHTGSYKFWSIYPADAALSPAPAGGTAATANQVQYKIEAPASDLSVDSEKSSDTQTVMSVDMDKAVMLAGVENAQYNGEVIFKYYPAFTAFEFTLKSAEEEFDLTKIVLSSTSDMVGQVTASIKEGTRNNGPESNINVVGASTFTYSDTGKQIEVSFPGGTKLTTDKELVFTVFALPQDIVGLTLEFYNDEGAFSKGTLKLNGDDITFGACQKHCIRGIAVKKVWDFTYLTLDIKPLDWVPVETEISSGDGVQATQFHIVGADNLRELKDAAIDADTSMPDSQKEAAKEANKAYRQWWVFPAGNTVTVTYKIMMPLVGTWAVEPYGDTDSFTVTSSTGALSGNLAGEDATATYITLTITSNATAQKSIYLKTTVTSGGETYSLDSETQLYDMRGYHYFIVNGDVNTNAL